MVHSKTDAIFDIFGYEVAISQSMLRLLLKFRVQIIIAAILIFFFLTPLGNWLIARFITGPLMAKMRRGPWKSNPHYDAHARELEHAERRALASHRPDDDVDNDDEECPELIPNDEHRQRPKFSRALLKQEAKKKRH